MRDLSPKQRLERLSNLAERVSRVIRRVEESGDLYGRRSLHLRLLDMHLIEQLITMEIGRHLVKHDPFTAVSLLMADDDEGHDS